MCQHTLIAKTSNSQRISYENLIYFSFCVTLRHGNRGKIFFCTFCILNVVSIITQLLIWSGFKEGRCVPLGSYTVFFIDCEKVNSQTYHRCPGWSWSPTGFSILFWIEVVTFARSFGRTKSMHQYHSNIHVCPVPWLQWCCQFLVALEGVVSSPCHSVSWGGANGNATDSETEGENFEENRHATRGSHCSLFILSACISNPGDLLRSSGCSKMWDRSFHESWMFF